jgi:hypothetical protein
VRICIDFCGLVYIPVADSCEKCKEISVYTNTGNIFTNCTNVTSWRRDLFNGVTASYHKEQVAWSGFLVMPPLGAHPATRVTRADEESGLMTLLRTFQ